MGSVRSSDHSLAYIGISHTLTFLWNRIHENRCCKIPKGCSYTLVLGLRGQVLVAGAAGVASVRSCQKLPPVSNEANASQLQDRPAAGQGRAHQRRWQCLWDNRFKKGWKNCSTTAAGREEWEYVRGTTLQSPRSVQKEGRRCSRCRSRSSLQPWSRP